MNYEATSQGLTYDQADDCWADLMDAIDGLRKAINALSGLDDSPASIEMLHDLKHETETEARRIRGIMDDCRRMELPPERLGA